MYGLPRVRFLSPTIATGIAVTAIAACQAGMSTTPPVTPVPPLALGLPLFLTPEPQLFKVEDEAGRPVAIALQHGVRDALEEAGFKLAPSAEAAAGIVVTVVIQKALSIPTDLFIKGGQVCGVRLDIARGDALLASAPLEVQCVATSSYYGMLPKDAAVALVNVVSHAPALIAVAESLHPPPPAPTTAPPPAPVAPTTPFSPPPALPPAR
jgi:hypothetical protein